VTVLLASELVANGVRHSGSAGPGGQVTVTARLDWPLAGWQAGEHGWPAWRRMPRWVIRARIADACMMLSSCFSG
jgi:hypothetical protein